MRLLLIEDEVSIANFLKEGLEEEFFAVDVAHNGPDGLEKALSNDYDLLLIDWMIPGFSGIEVMRRFRKSGGLTPVIMLTARDATQDAVFGLESGANDYIKKPFEFEELLARIRVQLRSVTEESSCLTCGPMEMNLGAHQFFYHGGEIELTPKEFALMEFLMRNKGQVCTRSRIIEKVWDIHFDADTSVIDVYINSLRKKLNATRENPIIRTVRGVGYLVKEE
ncbi:MAG: response regulator transcription factor [Calditrichaeota bacterium]|nr:response regulator transcription factor [Calditrichota bacterium]HQU71326.1 response regulator transcription factor [Calditrichia bacterium]